nr:cAMP dependant protein kinase, putative [Paramecium tetraurelia]
MMAFQVEDPIVDGTKQLIDFIYTQYEQNMNENGTLTKTEKYSLPLEKCTIKHFQDFNESTIYNKILKDQLNSYYCLPLNYTLTLEGTFKSNTFQYGRITALLCDTSSCYSTSEIQQFQLDGQLNNSFKINTLMLNRVANLNQESNYISYIYSDFYISTKIGLETKADIYLEKQAMTIENSVVPGIKDMQDEHVFSIVENKLTPNTVYTSNITKVASFYLRLSQSEMHYSKEYYRVDELISYVGGITKFLATVIGYFILRYNETGLQIKMANALYQFDMPEKKKGELVFSFQTLVTKIIDSMKSVDDVVQKFKHSAHRVIHMTRVATALRLPISSTQQYDKNEQDNVSVHTHRVQIVNHDVHYGNLKSEKSLDQSHENHHQQQQQQQPNLDKDKEKFLDLFIKLILESKKKLSFGVHFIVKQVSGSFKRNSTTNYQARIFEKSRKMILTDMDILVVMNKLQEIEKFKHIFLNKTQRKVFNYLPKPVVCVSEERSQVKHHEDQISENEMTNKKNDMLKQKSSSKSLLGGRQIYNTERKFKRLYKAYESLALNDLSGTEDFEHQSNKHNKDFEHQFKHSDDLEHSFSNNKYFEQSLNKRLLKMVEPTIQYSFNSLVELEKISRQSKQNKNKNNKRVITPALKNRLVQQLDSQNEEGDDDNDMDCITLKGSKKDQQTKRSPHSLSNYNIKKTHNTLGSSSRQHQEIKLTKVQSKQDLIDIEVFSS